MRLFGLKNCDSCRKAMKHLEGVEFVDVRRDGVSDELLERALERFGAALVNTRSTTWRNLDANQREREPLDILKEFPAFMKRPLIEKDGELFLGWGKDVQAALG